MGCSGRDRPSRCCRRACRSRHLVSAREQRTLMNVSLCGQVVAITGAARGIGRTTAEALISCGAGGAVGDIDQAALVETAATIGAKHHARVDVTDAESFRRFLAVTETCLGPVDVLINNAGIMPAGPFLDESDAVTRRIF